MYYADAQGDGQGARREAGPLLGRLLKALTGWVPDQERQPRWPAALQLSPVISATGSSNTRWYSPPTLSSRGSSHGNRKSHHHRRETQFRTHAGGKPVSQGDEIDVSRAEAEFPAASPITKIPAEPKADEKRDK
ncbi:hypothetical protein AAAC11_00055 [Pseudomonas aeruginosa]